MPACLFPLRGPEQRRSLAAVRSFTSCYHRLYLLLVARLAALRRFLTRLPCFEACDVSLRWALYLKIILIWKSALAKYKAGKYQMA